MTLEVGELCKALLTIVALIRLGIQMAQLMLLEVDQLREVAATALASKRLLARVCHFVAFHIALLGKGFIAKGALIWTLAAVYGIVSLQIDSLCKRLRAYVTYKGTHIVMDLHVAIQIAAVAEIFGAQFAFVGSFVMIVHLLAMERLIAFTFKRLRAGQKEYIL